MATRQVCIRVSRPILSSHSVPHICLPKCTSTTLAVAHSPKHHPKRLFTTTPSLPHPSFSPRPHSRFFRPPTNHTYGGPVDTITMHRQTLIEIANDKRRIKFCLVGIGLCGVGMWITIQFIELPEDAERKGVQRSDAGPRGREFEGANAVIRGVSGGAEVRKAGAEGTAPREGEGKAEDHKEDVPTGTSTVPYFPQTITLPRSSSSAPESTVSPALPYGTVPPQGPQPQEEEYTLLGLGIRTVSFLSIQVYVAGLYVSTADLATLQQKFIRKAAAATAAPPPPSPSSPSSSPSLASIPPTATALVGSEKDAIRSLLLHPQSSTQIWEELLKDADVRTAWRIVPTRNTDLAHLRDGWVRGITARARERGAECEDEAFGSAVADFKGVFSGAGRKALAKGKVMVLGRGKGGELEAWVQGGFEKGGGEEWVRLGGVRDERVGRLVWLGYLGGKDVASEEARRSVVEGVVEVTGRPLGSVETRVL